MQVLKTKNPLTESFLVQLDVDLEGSGLDIPTSYSRWKFGRRPPVRPPFSSPDGPVDPYAQGESPANTDAIKCSPLYEIRQTQGNAQPSIVQGAFPIDSRVNVPPVNASFPSLYTPDTSNTGGQPGQFTGTSMNDAYENMYGLAVQSLGTDTSPDNSNQEGSGSRPQSNHPTPSTLSNHTSSHTSYTSPPNQTGANNSAGGSQPQQSPSFPFPSNESWMIATNQTDLGSNKQSESLNFVGTTITSGSAGVTLNPTGMTPGLDSFWPTDGMGDGNEWIFGWPTSTPQP